MNHLAPESFQIHALGNGLQVLLQRMPNLRSVGLSLVLPVGTADERSDRLGTASMLNELMQRGAGRRSSRQFLEDLDFLGVERDSAVSTFYSSFSAAMVDKVAAETLEIFRDLVCEPHLPAGEVDEVKALAAQDLAGIEDEPTRKCFRLLRRLRYGDDYGRHPSGDEDGIEATTHKDLQQLFARRVGPRGSILSIAGNIDFDSTLGLINDLFGGWSGGPGAPSGTVAAASAYSHLPEPTNQTHIAAAWDIPGFDDPDYYASRALLSILGDGMSSRLFTEVRERRGLAYAVSASTMTVGNICAALVYAGTTENRAAETLEVITEVIASLADSLTDDELMLFRSRLILGLTIEQESAAAQAGQNASDWIHLGRLENRREIFAAYDALTTDDLRRVAGDRSLRNRTLVTLGPAPLEVIDAV